MKLNELKPIKGSKNKPMRIGRGEGSGKGGTSGRGHKGQKSRSGSGPYIGFEGGQLPLYRKLPRWKGFKNFFKVRYNCLNLDSIDSKFKDGDVVNLDSLKETGLIKKDCLVKVLGKGEIKKKLIIQAHKFSEEAKEKIEKSGSKFEVI